MGTRAKSRLCTGFAHGESGGGGDEIRDHRRHSDIASKLLKHPSPEQCRSNLYNANMCLTISNTRASDGRSLSKWPVVKHMLMHFPPMCHGRAPVGTWVKSSVDALLHATARRDGRSECRSEMSAPISDPRYVAH